MEEIAVSVICNAYNHEKYIKDALDGFVMQKTDFKFEVLVHDDASTDGTADIIREYEKKYPDLIKPIYQTENQYSKGNGRVGQIQRKRVKGKYVALCEGDDYWTDPYKLQKQYNAMEKHPEVDICAHQAEYIYAATGKKLGYINPQHMDGTVVGNNEIISVEDVIYGRGWYVYVATNSLFYRKTMDNNMPEFRKMLSLDYILQIHGALRGGMLYLSDIMSVYRYLSEGSWTATGRLQPINIALQYHTKKQETLKVLDNETQGKYHKVISRRIEEIEFYKLKRQKNYKELKNHPIYKEQSMKTKVKFLLECYAPWVLTARGMLKWKEI